MIFNVEKQRRLVSFVIGLSLLIAGHAYAVAAPTINVWYGLNQSFGLIGNPQAAINIVGNVSDPNGISSLSYTLNGGSSVPLAIGPDSRRLLSAGDFNIDINASSLNNGANTVVVTARNGLNQTSTETINVTYAPGNSWPPTYTADWSTANAIEDVAQVVDGHWTLSNGKIQPTFLGYDRLVAIGDTTWIDYEVTVPITIHSIDTGGYPYPSYGPGLGVLFRWTGHTDYPVNGWQPKTGYLPLGAIGWFHWDDPNDHSFVWLELLGNELSTMGKTAYSVTLGRTYIFKMRVESTAGQGSVYKLKVWDSQNSEPSSWTLGSSLQPLSDPQRGSVLLVSHHTEAEFGNVEVTQLPPPVPIQLSSFTATLQNNSVRLNWTTASETNNYGFDIQKSANANRGFTTIPNSFIPGNGTTLEPQHYEFVDASASAGSWYYRLKQRDLDGTTHFTDPVHINVLTSLDESERPVAFNLSQNYPNPFNPSTRITFDVPEKGRVVLEVFNPIGQRLAVLVDEERSAGSYDHTFYSSGLTSGVYFYKLSASGRSMTRKMVLIK